MQSKTSRPLCKDKTRQRAAKVDLDETQKPESDATCACRRHWPEFLTETAEPISRPHKATHDRDANGESHPRLVLWPQGYCRCCGVVSRHQTLLVRVRRPAPWGKMDMENRVGIRTLVRSADGTAGWVRTPVARLVQLQRTGGWPDATKLGCRGSLDAPRQR